jgi:hypothetical protein
MNIVISKLNLPCDLKGVIYSFTYDDLGYSHEHLKQIQKDKKRQQVIKLRQKVEISYWKKTGYSVSWLKSCVDKFIYQGAYLNKKQEFNQILDSRNVLTQRQIIFVIDSIFHPKNNRFVHRLVWKWGNPEMMYNDILDKPISLIL